MHGIVWKTYCSVKGYSLKKIERVYSVEPPYCMLLCSLFVNRNAIYVLCIEPNIICDAFSTAFVRAFYVYISYFLNCLVRNHGNLSK